MGSGYGFKCKKCGCDYNIHCGIGMMFPTVYKSCIDDVKKGVYGDEWKSIASCEKYFAVDASLNLYICNKCNNWNTQYSMSIYKPKSDNDIINKRYGEKTVKELGYVPYVTPFDLKDDYTFIKSYIHKCDKCGHRMHKVDIDHLSSLPCPKCGSENNELDMIRWD